METAAVEFASHTAQLANEAVKMASMKAATWVGVYIDPFWENKWAIMAATAFWFLHMRLSGSISHRLSVQYRKLSPEEQRDWCVRTCAITHAIFALFTIPAWLFPPESYVEDRLYAPVKDSHRAVLCLTLGYFIWDLCVCIWFQWGGVFLTHAVASLAVFYSALIPMGCYYLGFFLGAFEISTPMFHIRELMIAAKKEDSWIFHTTSYLFALTFTVFRVVGGTWMSIYWWSDALRAILDTPVPLIPVVVLNMIANVVVMGMQIFWFSKLVKAAFGGEARGGKKTT